MNKKGFTLTELIIVVVILGVIAGFGVPNYRKSVRKAKVRDAISNLKVVHAANQIYLARNGDFYPESAGTVTLSAINTNLNINVVTNGNTEYKCTNDGSDVTCYSRIDSSSDWLQVEVNNPIGSSNPCCDTSCTDVFDCT